MIEIQKLKNLNYIKILWSRNKNKLKKINYKINKKRLKMIKFKFQMKNK